MMRPRRAAALTLALAGLALAGCGGDPEKEGPMPLPSPPAGQAWQSATGFSFLHPTGWIKEARKPSARETFVAYTGPVTDAGVTPQIGLGGGGGYPNSLKDAVELAKLDNKARYRGYKIVREGPLKLSGAAAHRIEGTFLAFTKERPPVRVVDILAQTPERVQVSFYVLSADVDFERLGLERLARSFRTS